jgi:SAM-dependent methyltransferase
VTSFDQLYRQFKNVWGYEPSALAKKAAKELPDKGTILDISAGEGRDAIFFASLGHHVKAIETSEAAVEAIRKRIGERKNLDIETVVEDVVEMKLREEEYHLVFANMSLQFMTRGQRLELLDRIRHSVKKGGLVAIVQPTVEEPAWKKLQHKRDYVAGLCTLRFRGEVMNFAQVGEYRQEFAGDQIIEYWEGTVEDQGHPGYEKPHTHNVVSVIARIAKK